MRKTFATALILLCSLAANALPLVWRADWPGSKPVETLVHRGTDIEFQPQWYINGEPANSTNWTFQTFVQTNAQATGEWFGPLPGAAFSHTNDIGAAFYNVMARAQMPGGGVNYTAFARLRMLDSPGYTPGELPLPVLTIDFSKVVALNAPWLLPGATNGLATVEALQSGGIVVTLAGNAATADYARETSLASYAVTAGDAGALSSLAGGIFRTRSADEIFSQLDAAVNTNALADLTFDLSGEQGVMAALKACVEALGGSVTNMPPAQQ